MHVEKPTSTIIITIDHTSYLSLSCLLTKYETRVSIPRRISTTGQKFSNIFKLKTGKTRWAMKAPPININTIPSVSVPTRRLPPILLNLLLIQLVVCVFFNLVFNYFIRYDFFTDLSLFPVDEHYSNSNNYNADNKLRSKMYEF